MDVVTFGETMILMTPTKQGALDTVREFHKDLAGAESNVAIALARLGHTVAWVSKLGADSFGRFIYADVALDVAGALYEGGIRVIEVALNTDGAPDMIRRILDTYKEQLWVGAGTVLDVPLAEIAVNSGAQFFVTPISMSVSLTTRFTIAFQYSVAH